MKSVILDSILHILVHVYFSSSFLERIDSVSMDDYTPTDQVSITNGVGSEPRRPFL